MSEVRCEWAIDMRLQLHNATVQQVNNNKYISATSLLYWQTPEWSVAILTTWCQTSLSLAFLQAVWTMKFKDWRSSLIVLSQVVLGRPTGLLQSAGGLSAAAMTRWWSSLGAVWARCPKKLSQSDLTQPVTGEQVVMLRTVLLVVCLMYGIRKTCCRHQVLKASRRFASVLVH